MFLLIYDGFSQRMFDIGVYTVLTSVNPLRVYIFTADVLIRYGNIIELQIMLSLR